MPYPIPLQGLLFTTGSDPDVTSLLQSLATVLTVTVIYVYLIASVYPWLTMHLAWRKRMPYSDRGLLRVKFPEGRGVICEPQPRVKRYIPKYALFTMDGCKYIRLRVHRRVNFIRYDVVTFDRKGRLLDVLEVSERLTSEGNTRAVRLPTATAYAAVIPRQVDGEPVGREASVGYSLVGTAVYGGLTVLTTVFVGYMLHSELSYLLTSLTNRTPESFGGTLVVSLLVGIACAAWMVLMHYLHAVRKINR
ncbi:MAG: hypothetical protein J6B24_04995 [Clostridia bacterium]|nr:hypothetical protein [Clostridia bacterium]